MKRWIALCLALVMALSLVACTESTERDRKHHRDEKESEVEASQTSPAESAQSDTQLPAADAPPVEPTEEPVEEPTEVETPAPEQTGYLQRIERPDQTIYKGPSYDYGVAGVVEKTATYTIVEERVDDEGILWGRLKSGAGWVDLDDVRKRNKAREIVSGNFADDSLLKQDNVHQCVADDSEYRELLAFRFYEDVTNVRFMWLDYDGETLGEGLMITQIPEVKAGEALVASVVFYGDMTMFCLACVDSDGVNHYYSVSVSGRNGSLVFTEFQP